MKLTSNILSLVTTFACAALTAALPLNAAEPERIEHKRLPATSGGSISLEDVKGNADVETAGGSIKVAKR